MSTLTEPADRTITAAVTAWPGVTTAHGSRGEFSFRLGRREIGHLHGDRVAHFGFPRSQAEQLLRDGIVEPHPVGGPGWGARLLRDDEDVAMAVTLMRLNYDRAVARHGLPGRTDPA